MPKYISGVLNYFKWLRGSIVQNNVLIHEKCTYSLDNIHLQLSTINNEIIFFTFATIFNNYFLL